MSAFWSLAGVAMPTFVIGILLIYVFSVECKGWAPALGWGRHEWVERYVRRLGLKDRVEFLGHVPWGELQQRFAEADLFVFTSLRDTFGTVNLEALAKGCPVMCLNHQGVGTHLPDTVAIRVPVTAPEAVVQAMAGHIDSVASDRARLRRMSQAAYSFATTQQWNDRALLMEQLYRQVLARRAVTQTSSGGSAEPAIMLTAGTAKRGGGGGA